MPFFLLQRDQPLQVQQRGIFILLWQQAQYLVRFRCEALILQAEDDPTGRSSQLSIVEMIAIAEETYTKPEIRYAAVSSSRS